MGTDLVPLVDRINALLSEPPNGSAQRLLERMEHTLTDGYAHALLLEGQTLKLERQIGWTVARLEPEERAHELAGLADRLAGIESDLTRLRALLEHLRRRTEDVRHGVRALDQAGPDRVDGGLDPVFDL